MKSNREIAVEIDNLWQNFDDTDPKEFALKYPGYAVIFLEWQSMPLYKGLDRRDEKHFYLKQLEKCIEKYDSKLARALR